jgi:ATP synthase protein I
VSHDHDPPTPDDPASLDGLDRRLRAARAKAGSSSASGDREPGLAGTGSALGFAWRIGVELVAGLVTGVGGGLLLDHWFGSRPWCLVAGFFLGAAAGIANVYRAISGIGYAPGMSRRGSSGAPGDRNQ